MKRKSDATPAVFDANVIIDYLQSDKELFREFIIYFGTVYVPDLVLAEVRELSVKQAEEIGLNIVETPLSFSKPKGLSLQDTACLYFVKEKGWICVTNDKKLRNECIKAGGKVMWGLETLLMLVKTNLISRNKALSVAKKIKTKNPEVTEELMNRFIERLT